MARPALLAALVGLALLGVVLSKRLATRSPNPVELGSLAYERGDWSEALNLARRSLIAAPNDRQALRLLARSSARLHRDAETEALYSRLGVEGAEAEDFLLLGSCLLRRGQEGPGLRMLERARDAAPDRVEVLRELAEQYHRLGYRVASERAARALASQSASGAVGPWLLARSLLDLDQPVAAASNLEQVLQQTRRDLPTAATEPNIRLSAARAWLKAGRPTEAQRLLEPLQSSDHAAEAAWLLSRALLQRDDAKGAKDALARAGGFGRDDRTRAEPAPWVGHAGCAECHASIHRSQRRSHHAGTLAIGPGIEARQAGSATIHDPGNSQIVHEFDHRDGQAVNVSVSGVDPAFQAVFDYAIGSGNRGWTPIVRDGRGVSWEYRLTRYAAPVGWDLTIHHTAVPEEGLGYLGKPLNDDQVRDCLGCHSTNPDAVREGRKSAIEAVGIDCERCHGPAGNHLHAVRLGFPELAIAQPRLATGHQRDALCAGCHRAPKGFPEDAPDFVRFQSPTLARSRCSIESNGALDCVTCHNPHRDAATEPAGYEAICLNCHAARPAAGVQSQPSGLAGGKPTVAAHPCPVNATTGCVGCHMPRIPNVIPHTAYTDHYIRVRRD